MKHAANAVCALGGQRWPSVLVAIEARTPVDELARVARSLLNEHANCPLVADAVAGFHRVGRVERRRIVGPNSCGDSALRILRVAFTRIGFRNDDDVAVRRQFRGRAQTGDATADDDEIASYIHRVLSYCIKNSDE